MRAAVVEHYGPPEVVRIADLPTPIPKKGEVLVRVRAAAVTSGDARIRGARFPRGFGGPARLAFGLRGPRRPVLGGTFAGEVVAVGPQVDGVAVGDRVAGMTGIRMGTHAEFLAVRAARAVPIPEGVSDEDAAGVLFGGTTALFFLGDRVCPGSTVLVNGASGAIGTNAVQLAARRGATVTAVTSAKNAALVTSLGAAEVVDYARTDVTTLGTRFDLVLDTVGTLSIESGRTLLAEGGVLALAVAGLGETLRARGNVRAGSASERPEDFTSLLDLVARGELRVVTERVLDLADIQEAYRLVDAGRKVGNVLVRP